jgi:hypothetical protein
MGVKTCCGTLVEISSVSNELGSIQVVFNDDFHMEIIIEYNLDTP